MGSILQVRRSTVVSAIHKKYLSIMVDKVFCKCALRLVEKPKPNALSGTPVNMKEKFSPSWPWMWLASLYLTIISTHSRRIAQWPKQFTLHWKRRKLVPPISCHIGMQVIMAYSFFPSSSVPYVMHLSFYHIFPHDKVVLLSCISYGCA